MDLKSYKERMKGRELERTKNVQEGASQTQGPVRKSFIPDMSSTTTDSWLFNTNSTDEKEKTKDEKVVIKKEATSEHAHSSLNELRPDRHESNSGNRESSSSERRHERHSHQRHRHDEKRHDRRRHQEEGHDEKTRSHRSSSTELCISLKEKPHHRTETLTEPELPKHRTETPTGSELLSPSSQRHRSQTSQREQPKPPSDLTAESTPQDATSSQDGHSAKDNNSAPTSKKRSLDECNLENGWPGPPREKVARVIDYEHGAKTVTEYGHESKHSFDYEHGVRIVTDYGHGVATSQPSLSFSSDDFGDSSGEFGYQETKALHSVAVSTCSPSKLFNGKSSHWKDETGKTETNGNAHPSNRGKPTGQERHKQRNQELTKSKLLEKARAIGGAQAVAADKHFQAIGQVRI